MTLYYIDSSAWVKRYYFEQGTDPEVAAALVRQQASRRITAGNLNEIFEALEEDWRRFYRIPVDASLSNRAVALTRAHKLRGADSVHLAAVDQLRTRVSDIAVSVTLVCADDELNSAARAIGLPVINPTAPPN